MAVFSSKGQRTALISCLDYGKNAFCVSIPHIYSSVGYGSSFILLWVCHNLLINKRNRLHAYSVDISQNCLDVIDKNIALDADNVFAKISDVQKTAILLFAEYIDAATTIAAQSGGGGGGATSGWGRDKDEDELSWAHRCAIMANRLCRPRKKQGYGR